MLTKNDTELNRKSNQCKVVGWTPDGVYRITSPSGGKYTVDLERGGLCSCTWGQKGGSGCAHERCARRHWEKLHSGRAVSFLSGQPDEVAHAQHKAVKPVASNRKGQALTEVLRDRDPLHGVGRFCESWDGEAVDLFFEQPDGTDRHERREGMDYDALIAKARSQGWAERGLYWWRNVAE